MSPPEARSHCYLTPLSHRKIDTHPLQSGSTTKSDTLPFSFMWIHTPTSNYILSRLSQFVLRLNLITWVNLFSQTYIKMLWYLNPAAWCEMNEDLWKCMNSWEPARFRFALVAGRLWAAHSTPRPLALFTPSEWEKTSTRHETDHRMDRNSGPAATLSFGWRKWALPLSQTHLAALSPKWQEHC